MANKIQVKRGLKTDLPTLSAGEPGFCTDTKEAFIGDGTSNLQLSTWQEYAAHSLLAAVSADTPEALTVAEDRVVGRKTGGNIAALTGAEILALMSGQAAADFAMNTKKITGLADGVSSGDAVNKGQLDGVIAGADAMVFKGTVGEGGTYEIEDFNSLATYNTGWTFKAVTAGTIKGKVCEIGDMLIAMVTRDGSDQEDADWAVVQANIDGAVTGPASATDERIAVFDGATGKVIKDGGVLISGLATSGHEHGSITTDGKIGTTSGLIIKTGTDGALSALAAGSAGQFLKHDGTWDTPPDTTYSEISEANVVNVESTDVGLITGRRMAYAVANIEPKTHAHGSVTSDGKIGTTADLMIKTGTGGVLSALAAGSAGQYLKHDGTWGTPPDTDTATAADDILNGSNTGTQITYAPYTTSQAANLKFYTHATNPTGTSRLNLGGYFYATQLYDAGVRVLNANADIDGGAFA